MRRVGARIRGLVPTFVSCVRTMQNIRLFYHTISHLGIKINKNNLNLSNSIKGFDIVLSVNVAFTRPIYNIKRCGLKVFYGYKLAKRRFAVGIRVLSVLRQKDAFRLSGKQ